MGVGGRAAERLRGSRCVAERARETLTEEVVTKSREGSSDEHQPTRSSKEHLAASAAPTRMNVGVSSAAGSAALGGGGVASGGSGGGGAAGGGVAASGSADERAGDRFFAYQGKRIEIRNVWADTLEEEFGRIRALVDKYPFVAMDTEFPGVVARPIGSFASHTDYHYQTLRCNVDLLKIIQLGITFADADGVVPDGCPTWQFNFKFSLQCVGGVGGWGGAGRGDLDTHTPRTCHARHVPTTPGRTCTRKTASSC